MDRNYKKEFDREKAWGILTSLDIHNCDPHTIRDPKKIKEFVIQLCEKIEMKRFGEPQIINFGEDERVSGYSLTQLIETSLISAHFANMTNNVYLDVFSCKFYDPQEVGDFARDFFKGDEMNLHVILRK